MTARPTVLFVCVHNAGRSQMAAGFLTALSNGAVDVHSVKINILSLAIDDLLGKYRRTPKQRRDDREC